MIMGGFSRSSSAYVPIKKKRGKDEFGVGRWMGCSSKKRNEGIFFFF